MINIHVYDAVDYCAWLSNVTAVVYRLPSEAEWEYACRALTTTDFAFGNELTDKMANFNGNVGMTTEVGTYPDNQWGLFDMHGNVWEYCSDQFLMKGYLGAPTDGTPWIQRYGHPQISRGGSWVYDTWFARSAARGHGNPGKRIDDTGFRCARVSNEDARSKIQWAPPPSPFSRQD